MVELKVYVTGFGKNLTLEEEGQVWWVDDDQGERGWKVFWMWQVPLKNYKFL
jgi:hypothetical protein